MRAKIMLTKGRAIRLGSLSGGAFAAVLILACSAGSPPQRSVAPATTGPGGASPARSAPAPDASLSAGDGGTAPPSPVAALQLTGRAAATAPTDPAREPGPRLYSQQYLTWIWAKPKVKGRFLGTIRVGQSVMLRSEEKVPGQGCRRGFYRIEPRGYVCHDRTVTRDGDTPFLRAVRSTAPASGPFPYRYALSNGAPMYTRVPSAEEQRRTEWRYGKAGEFRPLGMFQRGHEHLATTEPIEPVDPLPAFLRDGGSARGWVKQLLRRTIPHGSMLSYTRAFDVDGRTFLLSADMTVVPADRVRKFRRSAFRGVELGDQVRLPLGWFRVEPRPRYHRRGEGPIEPDGADWPVRSWVSILGAPVEQDGRRYLPVAEPRSSPPAAGAARGYAAVEDVTVVRAASKLPFGIEPHDKWMEVRIQAGTLVAYEGLRPVFATLISPGQGGVPMPGRDHVQFSTTPLGAYRITYKDRAATMSPEMGEDRSFWIADVPFTQYFNPPFALHGAYWHEKFGEYMSGGCVNASPTDAEWLFDWTDPPVPEGWQGATGAAAKENGPASWVVVRR